MTESKSRRITIGLIAQLVALVFAIPAFYEAQNAGLLTPGFTPAWWFWPAFAGAVLASLYSLATLWGLIHQPQRTTDEIHEEILDE